LTRHARPAVRGTSEQEAREAELRVPPDAAGVTRPGQDQRGAELEGVRLHRDAGAAGLTEAVGAQAVTVGDHVYLSRHAPAPDSAEGQRLLAHELTHVLQQRSHGERLQRFTAAEHPLIAKDLAAMMTVIEAIVNASSAGEQVLMGDLVRNSGGRDVGAALPRSLRSDSPVPSMLSLRYLMTRRCGLVDMRHFMQLLYISWFGNVGNAGMANRGATKKGIEHEEKAEAASRFGPEDLTSNALGAWTATRLAGIPQRGDLIARIRETLERCAPIDFDALSPASQTSLVDFYAAQTGAGEPANQNRTAVALIPVIPELAGQDRSFPFELDDNDPKRATISGAAFDTGASGLTGDSEIRSFVATQREQVLREIPAAVRGRLGARLLKGWVSDDDLDAFERLFLLADSAGKAAMRGAAAGVTLSSIGQRTRLRLLLGTT
jgi:hypothetical protein